jgi:quinoprotein glucose dehydrogenase
VNTRHLGVIAQLAASTSSGVLPSFSKQKMPTTFYTDPQGYPCNAPPWSEIIAVSTSTGDIVWRTPLGEYAELTAKGIKGTGTVLNDGGPIATASGLVFIGSTGDFGFRAFDGKTGREVWKATLGQRRAHDADDVHGRPTANSSSPPCPATATRRSTSRPAPTPANTKLVVFALP